MIRKGKEALSRSFKGVAFDVLAVGQRSMVTKMRYKTGDKVPSHSHPNEQSGYVISGKYELGIEGDKVLIEKGDSYSIPADMAHSLSVIQPGEVIDVFTPIREDYL